MHDGILAAVAVLAADVAAAGKQRPYVATTEQVWALHDAMPEHLRAAILLGAFAGLRVAEACGLRVADVDFMRGVDHPGGAVPGRAAEDRDLADADPDPARASRALLGPRRDGGSGEHLLVGETG